jgi:hypothetical protein
MKILHKGYPQAFAAAGTGDPKEYAHSLLANPKRQYYDATVEKSYTSGMNRIYSQYMKSQEFDAAYRSAVNNVDAPAPSQNAIVQNTPASSGGSMLDIVNNYLHRILASEKPSKKLYKQYLPSNDIVISVKADYTDAIEFSRVLCSVLEEELMAKAFTHVDGQNVEVECSIHGPADACLDVVKEVTQATAQAFKKATAKIGGIEVKPEFLMNKKSSFQQINIKTAINQHRIFLLKFI